LQINAVNFYSMKNSEVDEIAKLELVKWKVDEMES
jgi:ABC-type Zn2+ transport system substrate-binding protein/surface adhesin